MCTNEGMAQLTAKTLALAFMISAVGCSGATSDDESSDAIIGGRADATTAPAVGALVDEFVGVSGPLYRSFCTATLVAPRRVVTAKHCVRHITGKAGFALGFIATTTTAGVGPTRVVAVDSFVEETSVADGATRVGYGIDMAVVRLKEAINDVEPLALGAISPDDVDKTFTVIGYGLRSDGGSGARRSGKVTLKATAGRVLEPLVSFERYSEEYGGSREENRKEYDETVLLEGYEVVTAPQRGAQVCDGDSGGPLLRPRGATFEVVGVASYVLATPLKPCTFGAVYTTFGPKARRLVERETR